MMMTNSPFPFLCFVFVVFVEKKKATEVEHQKPQTKQNPEKRRKCQEKKHHQQQKEKRKGKKGTRRTNEKICESEEVVFNVFVTIG